MALESPHFNGPTYTKEYDHQRLASQFTRILGLMIDHQWRTLSEIAALTGDHEASISAQLRHAKKERFGSYRLEKRRRGICAKGLYEYRILDPLLIEQHTGQLAFV